MLRIVELAAVDDDTSLTNRVIDVLLDLDSVRIALPSSRRTTIVRFKGTSDYVEINMDYKDFRKMLYEKITGEIILKE